MIFTTAIPRALPVVWVHGVRYFVDVRLRQLRRVDDPRRVVHFERKDVLSGEN